MVVTPGARAFTNPEADPIVATEVLLLLQSPNGEESLNKVVEPEHNTVDPLIAAGNATTVTTFEVVQPVLVIV